MAFYSVGQCRTSLRISEMHLISVLHNRLAEIYLFGKTLCRGECGETALLVKYKWLLGHKLQEGRGFYLLCSLMYPSTLELRKYAVG